MAKVRPIDANELLELYAPIEGFVDTSGCKVPISVVIQNILDQPTLGCEPVSHGEWVARKEIFDGDQEPVDAIGCSLCGKSQRVYRRTVYCPNCGAKMDGGKNDET